MNLELSNKLNTAQDDYVLSLDVNCEENRFAFSTSSHSIFVGDVHTLSLVTPDAAAAHSDTVDCVQFFKSSPQQLFSASADKSVCFWDLRDIRSPTMQLRVDDEVNCAAIGLNDSLFALGVGNDICFYDIRSQGNRLGVYSDCHTDIVTRLEFNPSRPAVLLSGGEDGLVCTYDTAVPAQEDAVLSILNTDCAVREAGFFGNESEGVYCLSTIETASFWHYPSAQRLGHFPSIRNGLGADYLVTCWGVDSGNGDLLMLSGTHTGEGKISNVNPSSVTPQGILTATGGREGHVDTIRCARPFGGRWTMNKAGSMSRQCLFTGGEDGAVCLWTDTSSQCSTESIEPNINIRGSGRTTEANKRQGFSRSMRYKPY